MRQLWPERRADVDLDAVYGAERPLRPGRPWLLLNMIASVDGATSVEGVSAGLGGPADKRVFAALRAAADVVLVGAGTVRAEGYGPPQLPDEVRDARSARGEEPVPRIAIVTRSLDLDFSANLFTAAEQRPVIITTTALPAGRRAAAGNRARVMTCGDDEVDLDRALLGLAEMGARIVLCEGGPRLNGDLIAAGLVDEACTTVAPLLAGGSSARMAAGADVAPQAMVLDRMLEADGLLFQRWLRAG